MKKFTFRSLLAIAAAGVLFTACKDENDDGNTSKTTYEFSVKAEDNPISAPADGKTYTILVTSTKTAQAGTSAVAYEVVSSPEWAPAELEQTALVITVAKNSSTEAREPGKVVLKQDESDKTLEITINQAGFSNSMSLDATYSTDRCKVLVIEPTITGFDQNPVYKWTVKGPNDAEAAEAGTDKTLSFIQLETGDYTISLTISDDSGITETKSATVTVTTEATAYSHYISEVLEYNPAITNGKGLAFSTIDTPSTVLASVNTKLVDKPFDKNDLGVNLGSFGGSIVFRFDHTVMNVNGLRDFRIGSYATKGAYPAQGVVYVSSDANGNGKADEVPMNIRSLGWQRIRQDRRTTQPENGLYPSRQCHPVRWNGRMGLLCNQRIGNRNLLLCQGSMGDILGLARMVDGIGRGHRTDIYGLHDAAASGQGPGRSDERLANSSFPLVRLRLCLQQRPHG